MKDNLIKIHESLVNGQRKQMAEQIDDYGIYDFFDEYVEFLKTYFSTDEAFTFFQDAVISYHHIKHR